MKRTKKLKFPIHKIKEENFHKYFLYNAKCTNSNEITLIILQNLFRT